MIKIALCDDNETHLKYSRQQIGQLISELSPTLRCFSSGAALLAQVQNGFHPDIAIIDIEMPDLDGISLAQQLNRLLPDCRIIFLTSYQNYASEAYLADHLWFVFKPTSEKYLPLALQKAIDSILMPDSGALCITIKQQRSLRKIRVSDILYLERITYRTRIVLPHNELLVTQSPAKLLEGLPDDCFIHCHQSYWINKDKITSQIGSDFILINGAVIPISRSMKKEAVANFLAKN